jgi:hypothetical protein
MFQRLIIPALAFVILTVAVQGAEKALTNDDVIAMVKAGLDSSTVLAKITQSGRDGFDTSVEGLIKLKKAGAGKDVIDAMLGVPALASNGTTAPTAPKPTDVQLVRPEGPIDLQSLEGEASATYIGIGFMTWLNFDGQHSSVTTADQNVVLRIRSPQRPDSRVYVVRLDVNDNDRSVKMGRQGMFSATAGSTPDRDWTFRYDSAEEQDGVWKLTLQKPLPKGEYGVLRGTELFDFAIE